MDYLSSDVFPKEVNIVLSKVFGYIGTPFPLGKLQLTNPLTSIGKIGQSFIGQNNNTSSEKIYPEIDPRPSIDFYDIKLEGNDKKEINLENAIINFSKKNNIIKTEINGRKGTVKELWGAEDWILKIAIVCVNRYRNDYPYDSVKEVAELFQKQSSIKITNELCTMLGINYIVLENIQIHDIKGKSNIQVIELDAISDDDYVADLI